MDESQAAQAPVKQQPEVIPDFMVTAVVLAGTLNVVRLLVMPRFTGKGQHQEVIMIGDYVFAPGMDPNGFKIIIDNAAAAAGRAVAGFLKGGKTIGANPQTIMSICDLVIEAVRRKLQGGILSPDGKTRQIAGVEKNGVMKGDINEFLNMPNQAAQKQLVLPEGATEEAPTEAPSEKPEEEAPRELKLDF